MACLLHRATITNQSQVYSPFTTAGLEMETAYSYFGASQIYHLLTYLLRHLPTYLQPRTHTGLSKRVCV